MIPRVHSPDDSRAKLVVSQACDNTLIGNEHERRSNSYLSFGDESRAITRSRRSASVESDIPSAQPQPSFSFPPVLSPRVVHSEPLGGLSPPPSVAPSSVAEAVSDSSAARDTAGSWGQSGLNDIVESLTEHLLRIMDARYTPASKKTKADAVDVMQLPQPHLNVNTVSAMPRAMSSTSAAPTAVAATGQVTVPSISLMSPIVPPPLCPFPIQCNIDMPNLFGQGLFCKTL